MYSSITRYCDQPEAPNSGTSLLLYKYFMSSQRMAYSLLGRLRDP
jgi:hypothetical protein